MGNKISMLERLQSGAGRAVVSAGSTEKSELVAKATNILSEQIDKRLPSFAEHIINTMFDKLEVAVTEAFTNVSVSKPNVNNPAQNNSTITPSEEVDLSDFGKIQSEE